MSETRAEILKFVAEYDVKFVRLAFCDPFGVHKNMAILADELPAAFENGVTFDAYAVNGFSGARQSDLLLYPIPSTMTLLPWRPGTGRVARFFCDIKNPDGSSFEWDGRHILQRVNEKLSNAGFVCIIGTECEFYLFKTDENGVPTLNPIDSGGYLDIAPVDKAENIRREICLILDEMGLKPETSHHEKGPGQNEIDFKFNNPVESADNFLTFKSAVKSVAERNGLFASFMPKPLAKSEGSGLHVNISLIPSGANLFDGASAAKDSVADSFLAGILEKIPEITLFLNPTANSYERLGSSQVPKYVSWSHRNGSQLVKIPPASGNRFKLELRSPDSSVNPYIAFALILAAGLSGIERQAALPPPIDTDLYTAPKKVTDKLTQLPEGLGEAIALSRKSAFVKGVLGEDFLNEYIKIKEREEAEFLAAEDRALYYKNKYFRFI